MKVLYITGACLTKNTSANMSHNGYVKGLLDCGCEVDIIMAKDSWGAEDKVLSKWEKARYYEFKATSFSDKLRKWIKKSENITLAKVSNKEVEAINTHSVKKGLLTSMMREWLKKIFYYLFKPDPIYPLSNTWLKEAQKFNNTEMYDLVISNSSPSASHKLVVYLSKKKRIHYKRWVQIWEDPWFYDLYSAYDELIKKEEHHLLQKATEIYYVSPLTLMYQQKYFSDCAGKMKCVPLPFFEINKVRDAEEKVQHNSFGYFGDYYSVTRNLVPFYSALQKIDCRGYIYGDTDIDLASTEKIKVKGRVTLDILSRIQSKVHVLVHLCNLRGGQIPGKIYHYSATDKPILFILDGTEDEIQKIIEFFSPFNRYVFCKNSEEDIYRAMLSIINNNIVYTSVKEFSPEEVVNKILRC